MLPPLPANQSLLALFALSTANVVALRVCLPSAWRFRAVKFALALALALLLIAHLGWCYGALVDFAFSYYGAAAASSGNVVLVFLLLSFPLAALLRTILQRATNTVSAAPSDGPTLHRRTFVSVATAAIPLASVGSALSGFQRANDLPLLPRRELYLSRLPRGLDGLSILQLSDLHLGAGRTLSELEEALRRISESNRPDLIVVTGDVADNMDLLAPALSLVESVRPRLGSFACLGNHEYLHDVARARRTFERSSIPLLVDEGLTVKSAEGDLYLAGIDDPFGRDFVSTLRASVDASLLHSPTDSCTVMLSHRPEGFLPASTRRVDLTLSGHTHGGQIGFAGKSAFEPLFSDGYLWGAYGRGTSRLYTTSGFGHWFPFRLGCPTETPLIVLRARSIEDTLKSQT